MLLEIVSVPTPRKSSSFPGIPGKEAGGILCRLHWDCAFQADCIPRRSKSIGTADGGRVNNASSPAVSRRRSMGLRVRSDRMVQPVIGSLSSPRTGRRRRGLLVAISSWVKGTHLIDPVCSGRFSIGKLRRFHATDNDPALPSDGFRYPTDLINQLLYSHSGRLFYGISIEIRPVASTSLQPGHVEQIFDCDASTFERSGIAEVFRIQSRWNGDRQGTETEDGRGQVVEITRALLDRRGGECLCFVSIGTIHLGQGQFFTNIGEVWARRDLVCRDVGDIGFDAGCRITAFDDQIPAPFTQTGGHVCDVE